MQRILTLAFVLLCSAAWLQAQQTTPQGSYPGSDQTQATSSQTSVEGCLQGSNGTFTLTDSSGMTYQLEGDASMLSKHVGHEVRVTGSVSGSGTASSAGSTSPGGSPQTLTVTKVKHISENCKTAMSK
jgi:hypothetical protein